MEIEIVTGDNVVKENCTNAILNLHVEYSMLSKKVIDNLKSKGWWFDDASQEYQTEIVKLGIKASSDACFFYTHAEDGPTFYNRGKEIYQLGWFLLNADYSLDLKRTHEILNLPTEWIPLDAFEGEHGLFYNKENESVLSLGVGKDIEGFHGGKLDPQWNDFNSFIEWYFNL